MADECNENPNFVFLNALLDKSAGGVLNRRELDKLVPAIVGDDDPETLAVLRLPFRVAAADGDVSPREILTLFSETAFLGRELGEIPGAEINIYAESMDAAEQLLGKAGMTPEDPEWEHTFAGIQTFLGEANIEISPRLAEILEIPVPDEVPADFIPASTATAALPELCGPP